MLVEALKQGLPTHARIALLLWAIFLGIEGAGIVIGYFLFAEFLGIFREQSMLKASVSRQRGCIGYPA